ncbi:glucokinase [Novispirillum itersonii]|uniref:Glucokinase n=1 Tax=Novispirillum itersonii TaxID=189 RepID=A0A7W9ZKL8_NOVIT|nr:glucokinase [Novispirillum itersonii]MBB6212232.1 glucokinase [Novispirillum itersonii]
MDATSYPRLLGDIGGTNARFALETAPGIIGSLRILPTRDHAGFAEALHTYLTETGTTGLRHAAIGIATAVTGDHVSMTNHPWSFSIAEIRSRFGLDTFLVLNDFTVLALSLPRLPEAELEQIGGTVPRAGAKALIGPGTGLGVSGLLPSAAGWIPLAGEGGHVVFSPCTEEEEALARFARSDLGLSHLSAERLITGSGLELIDRFLASLGQQPDTAPRQAPEISRAGLAGTCPRATAALTLFCTMFGTAAANLALTLGAVGGVYIGGGIIPRFGSFFAASPFRQRFEAQGRLSAYLAPIPVYVIHSPTPALLGASNALDQHLALPQT